MGYFVAKIVLRYNNKSDFLSCRLPVPHYKVFNSHLDIKFLLPNLIVFKQIQYMQNSNTSADLPNAHLFGIMADELNETLWCDFEFIKILRMVSKNGEAADLRKECDEHAWQIEEQVVRLKKASVLTGVEIQARENHIMAALLNDTVEALEKYKDTETLDTVVISALRKACRFRRAMYQSVITYFGLLGFEEPELIIAKSYREEDMAEDRLLSLAYTKLADLGVDSDQ